MRALILMTFALIEATTFAADVRKSQPEEVRPDLASKTVEVEKNNVRTERTYDQKGYVIKKTERSAIGKESTWLYFYDMTSRLVTLLNPDQSRMLYEYSDDKSTKPSRIKLIDTNGHEQEIL